VTVAAALAGWAVALLATVAAVLARVTLASRAEAVARACHELRGPLTAVRLGMELGLRAGPLTAERMRATLLELDRAALALGDLSGCGSDRLSDAPADLAREPVGVSGLLKDSVEAWRPAARAARATLRLSWRGEPATVLGSRTRLAQATGNLIANAIEHGGETIEVRGSASGGWVRVEVLDDGPGLDTPIAQLRRPARWRRSGRARGHGLAICAAVAAAHGGRLASAPSERGARLVLELPVAPGGLGVRAVPVTRSSTPRY
jgi:signal transduction histidine kinase